MSTDPAQWTPTTTTDSSAPRCQNCGNQVSRRFARISGDNRDVVHACPGCATNRELHREASNADSGGAPDR
ncbi:hypothetical protein CP556_24985 [Natrinema sp. CBA1119]|uniref:DUF7563 family protein n=1 Tax=Natrinema sp. CBA1119 TaxID=1608465 RepID=UPI000BF64778|nr:hypothetical protein [Natrinema sp. CBA1119]PGF14261.1 hypothetical protein CP556_24985 [Natrinema sp. CBA1119]